MSEQPHGNVFECPMIPVPVQVAMFVYKSTTDEDVRRAALGGLTVYEQQARNAACMVLNQWLELCARDAKEQLYPSDNQQGESQ